MNAAENKQLVNNQKKIGEIPKSNQRNPSSDKIGEIKIKSVKLSAATS